MKFPTQFTKHERVYADPGSPYEDTYSLKVDDNGVKDLVKTGKINVYEKIQSYKDSTDLNVMIEKYLNGDAMALNRKVGAQFIDVTKMPQNLVEVYQMNIDAKNYFDALPLDIRKEFGFDFGRFMASSDAELVSVFNKFEPTKAQPEAVVIEEKKEGVTDAE